MKNLLENTKNFKIIPVCYKSSGEFELLSIDNNTFKAKLKLSKEEEIKDYKEGGSVEVFGVNNSGLVYFETSIIKVEKNEITLGLVSEYSVIQRREYSRVKLDNGKFIFKDLPEDFVEKVEDISAGGIKFIAKYALSIDKLYGTEIILSNNMKINCSIRPIRQIESDNNCTISAKFVNLDNADRIVLVQYAFKIKMEQQT